MARGNRLTNSARQSKRISNAQRRLLRIESLENRHMLAGLVVTSLADNVVADGLITLREALHAANNDTVADSMVPSQVGSGTDVITFAPSLFSGGPAAIVLSQGQLVISSNLTLHGPGASLLTIDASGNDPTPTQNNGDGSRVININDGNVNTFITATIAGVTITGGDLDSGTFTDAEGGGIRSTEHLILSDSAVVNNSANSGGGVSVYQFSGPFGVTAQIIRSRISGNTAYSGGGLYAGGTLTSVIESTIENNVANSLGGGIIKNSGTLTINGSTISGNTATDDGGGLWTRYGATTITNSTLSGNTTSQDGGGIYAPLRSTSAKLYINHSTLTSNSAPSGSGGGIYLGHSPSSTSGTAKFNHTIIAGNSDNGTAPDLDFTTGPGAIALEIDYSLIGQNTGSGMTTSPTPNVDGNLIGGAGANAIDPLLSVLADHGGPTFTHRLKAGSPAINAGNAALVAGQGATPLTDQRGTGNSRIRGHVIDIGAVEVPLLPGDYNFSSIVDQADHAYWAQNFGATSGNARQADGNNDGTVNAADYVLWRKLVGTYEDDHGNSASLSTTVNVPTLTQGNLQAASDVDWFKFTATNGKSYQFAVNLLQLTNSRLRLFGTDGTSMLLDDNNGGAALLDWTAPAAGTYFLEVSSASSTGTYQLSILGDDHGNSSTTSTAVYIPTLNSGALHTASDVDWFQVYLSSGYTYVFDTELLGLASSGLRLIGTNGTTVLQQDTNGGAAQIVWAATQSGNYFLEVSSVGGSTGTYQLRTSRDEANTATLAGHVGTPSNTAGTIFQVADADWFQFTIAAAGTATVSTTLGTLTSSGLQVYASNGTTLIGSDTNGGTAQVQWAASVGTYYARVTGFGISTGSYTLNIALDAPDDHGDTDTTATPISVPSDNDGVIEVVGDQDWFSFTAQAGTEYTINIQAISIAYGMQFSLYDSSGFYLDYGYEDFDLVWSATSSDTYYIEVTNWSDQTGSYSLSVESDGSSGGDDHGNTSATATHVFVPDAVDGIIEELVDEDWFSFTAQAGADYTIWTVLSGLGDSTLTLYDSNGTQIAYNDDYNGLASQIEWTAPVSGIFHAVVRSYGDYYTGAYTLQMDAVGLSGDDHGDWTTVATPVSVPSTNYGTIEVIGDEDWFSFTAQSGNQYDFDLIGISLPNADLVIYNSLGTQLVYAYYNPSGVDIEWTATSNGTFHVAVISYGSNIGTYSLSIDDGGGGPTDDDYGNSSSAATSVLVPSTTSGVIEVSGDKDWFSFTAQAGTQYIFKTSLNSLSDSVLTLYGTDGSSQLKYNDDYIGLTSQIWWTAATSGTYYIAVGGFSDNTGSYSLIIENAGPGDPVDDHGNTPAISTQVYPPTIPALTSGSLHNATDVDWFRFSASSGITYFFDTVLLGLTSSSLRLFDTNGTTVLQQDTNGGTAQITWTAPQSGTYFLEVAGVSGSTGTYQLRNSRDEADTSAAAQFVSIPTNLAATIYQAGDVDWFRLYVASAGTTTVLTTLGTLTSSVLHIYANDGTTLIGSDTDGGAAQVQWTSTAETYYYARVSALGGVIGGYTLNVAHEASGGSGSDVDMLLLSNSDSPKFGEFESALIASDFGTNSAARAPRAAIEWPDLLGTPAAEVAWNKALMNLDAALYGSAVSAGPLEDTLALGKVRAKRLVDQENEVASEFDESYVYAADTLFDEWV